MNIQDQYRNLASTGKVRRVMIGRRDLLHMFFIRGAKYPVCISIPEIENLPSNCTIIHSYMDEDQLGYVLIVHSDEFDAVPNGERIPHIEARFRYVSLAPPATTQPPGTFDSTQYFSQVDALLKELNEYRRLFEDTKHDVTNPDTKKIRIVAEMWGYQLGRANCITDIGKLLPRMIGAVDRVFLSDELDRMRREHPESKTTLDPNIPYNQALDDLIARLKQQEDEQGRENLISVHIQRIVDRLKK